MKFLEKKYYSIYLVSAIIAAGLIFMGVSTAIVMKEINGGTSMDIALQKAKKECNRKNGALVELNGNDPLNTKCIIGDGKINTKY